MMNKPGILFVFAVLFCHTVCFGSTAGTVDSAADMHLFELDEPLFDRGYDRQRRQWEKDFMAHGKELEKNPGAFVQTALGWLNISGESQALLSYKHGYAWNSGLYYYPFFILKDYDIFYTKEAIEDAYLFNRIDRSGENISRLWAVFGSVAEQAFDHLTVKGRPERTYIMGLLNAWNCITQKENYETKLREIYDELDRVKPGVEALYDYAKPLMCEELSAKFIRQSDWGTYYDVQWLYTFWVRRYHEGNALVVVEILKSLL